MIQIKLRLGKLYGLSSWVGSLLGPAVSNYHSRTTQREIEREIPKIVCRGSLPELLELIDNVERRNADLIGFNEAQKNWQTAQDEIIYIEGEDGDGTATALRQGQHFTAISSVILSMAVVTIILFLQF